MYGGHWGHSHNITLQVIFRNKEGGPKYKCILNVCPNYNSKGRLLAEVGGAGGLRGVQGPNPVIRYFFIALK